MTSHKKDSFKRPTDGTSHVYTSRRVVKFAVSALVTGVLIGVLLFWSMLYMEWVVLDVGTRLVLCGPDIPNEDGSMGGCAIVRHIVSIPPPPGTVIQP